MSQQRIMYVCSECADSNPEGCGHFDPNDLRVFPDGRWLCESCFDDTSQIDRGNSDEEDFKSWSDLSAPPPCAIQPQRMPEHDEPREPTPHWQRRWPHDQPNGWNLDSAGFLKLIQENPLMWLALGRAKYLEMRIDTRDGGFNLYDRDKKPLNPDDVIEAINKVRADFGKAALTRPDVPPQRMPAHIETAPTDGSHILAWRIPIGIRTTNNTNPPTVVHWFDDPDEPGFYTSVNERAPEHPFSPTHWMPLPNGPALTRPEQRPTEKTNGSQS